MSIEIERPFPEYAIPRVWSWVTAFKHTVFDDFGPKDVTEFVEQWLANDQFTWGVLKDGELGGAITAQRQKKQDIVALACVFKRSFWGHDTTVPALRMVLAELFTEHGIAKVTVLSFRDNHSLQSMVRALGGKREGILENQSQRNGMAVDLVITGIQKERFQWQKTQQPARKSAPR